MSLITLTTDFGQSSNYVAIMKGVILSINPSTTIVDLSHQIPPQDLRYANYFLATTLHYFPSSSIHVAVIDPGVGTDREILLAKFEAQYLLVPNNGIATTLLERYPPTKLWKLTESKYWRASISSTFHGRDIFAPVAAHLAMERKPERFGEEIKDWVRLPGEPFRADGHRAAGSIQFVDSFGNLISNIPAKSIPATPPRVSVSGRVLDGVRWVQTYGEANPGELVVLGSSDGFVEIAVVNGNAAERLKAAAGDPIELVHVK